MLRKYLLISILLIFFPIFSIYAQEENLTEEVTDTETEKVDNKQLRDRPDFWLSIGGETAFYSASGLAYGGSFAFGYGSGSSIGLKTSFFSDGEEFKILEMNLLLRFYMFGKNTYWGPFIQFIGGASFINFSEDFLDFFALPSKTGVINGGLGIGWRFIYNNRLFLEPAVRMGYPYFLGLGLSAGIRF
jgi:hypothetical protein